MISLEVAFHTVAYGLCRPIRVRDQSCVGSRAATASRLALETRGEPDRPGIVFAHGFGQTRRAWAGSAAMLRRCVGYRTVTFDARGHGDSGWRDEQPYDWEQMRRRSRCRRRHIAGAAGSRRRVDGRPASALPPKRMHGPLFRALVLVDVTPRWEPRGVDRILNFMRAHPHGFDSLDEAADGDRGVSAAPWRAQIAAAPSRAA